MSWPRLERVDQPGVLGEVGDAAQLDLVVVGDEQLAARRRARTPCGTSRPRSRAHRDVVQVRRVGADSRPVRATVWLNVAWMRPSARDLGEQALAVGRPQLLDLAVAQQVLDDRVLAGAASRALAASVEKPGLRLLLRRQAELVEQDLRSCGVELTLNSSPASSEICCCERVALGD